jgi:hypothetical protein
VSNSVDSASNQDKSWKRADSGDRHKVKTFVTGAGRSENNKRTEQPRSSSVANGSATVNRSSCLNCSQMHLLEVCENFKRLLTYERYAFVQEKRLCRLCLSAGHIARNCGSDARCTVNECNKRHSSLFHFDLSRADANQDQLRRNPLVSHQAQGTTNLATDTVTAVWLKKLMPVVQVKVWTKHHTSYVETYALLDSCSSDTFCSKHLAKRLKVRDQQERKITLTTLAGENEPVSTSVVSLIVSGEGESSSVEYSLPVVLTRDVLPFVGGLGQPVDNNLWPHLRGINLPCIERSRIGMII